MTVTTITTITTITTTTHDAELIRGGSEDDVARLLRCGGRVVRRGNTLLVREMGEMVLQIPYALIAFGASRRRILVLLSAGRDEPHDP